MDLSIAEATKRLGVSWDTWNRWRAGQAIPPHIALLCSAIYHRLEPWPVTWRK